MIAHNLVPHMYTFWRIGIRGASILVSQVIYHFGSMNIVRNLKALFDAVVSMILSMVVVERPLYGVSSKVVRGRKREAYKAMAACDEDRANKRDESFMERSCS